MRIWQRARKLREIPTRNRKLTADRAGPVWSRRLEREFSKSFVRYIRVGKKLQTNGQSGTSAQNDWISKDLLYHTGCKRTARQVSSHLQQRRCWFKKKYGDAMTWDECVLSLDDSSDSDGEDDDDDDEMPPSLVTDSDASTMCDSPGPSTPLSVQITEITLSPESDQATTLRVDALLSDFDALGNSWLYDGPLMPAFAVPDVDLAPHPPAYPPIVAQVMPVNDQPFHPVELFLAPQPILHLQYTADFDALVPGPPAPMVYQQTMVYSDSIPQYAQPGYALASWNAYSEANMYDVLM
ncbi:hypothetical protein AURDEDRAFT_121019 [Auricularia subglabra TFB-10046 SS5]|nr:hypothetical protein AURDEDRAFT_121019 [Auricularia subglabra TFB-10046 SS5]